MLLSEQINEDLGSAMKAGDSMRTGVLRLVKNSLKNEQIKLGEALDEAACIKVLGREAKQRRDSIEAYLSGNRPDLVQVEQAELEIIQGYLPAAMSTEALIRMIDQAMTETGATGVSQTGQVMGRVMSLAGGRADGSEVARLVRERLA